MKDFLLMHKDRAVASISLKFDERKIGYLHTNEIFNRAHLPYGCKNADFDEIDQRFTDWNDYRCIPFGRPNYAQLLLDNNVHSTSELLSKSYMCSLTDCYWFKPENSNMQWKDVNFRDNGFSSNLYKRLFYNQNG